MGAGISLGEEQISAIVKRDLTDLHETKMREMPPCLPEYTAWRNSIAEGYHRETLDFVDKAERRVKEYKNTRS
jgi:hypothetical protein